jgi:glycosyltransferase involved in cell wall biosynthesis
MQGTSGRVLAAVPAYNEESYKRGVYLGRVLEGLCAAQQAGLLESVLLVDDGSTDDTASFAASRGVRVVSHRRRNLPWNRGKAAAFKTAARRARRLRIDILLLADADFYSLKASHIEQLLTLLSAESVEMVRAVNYQENPDGEFPNLSCPLKLSGFRAIRMSALRPLFDERDADHARWERYLSGPGFCLEAALERLIPFKKEALLNPALWSRPRGKGAAGTQIDDGIEYVNRLQAAEYAARFCDN